MKRIYLIFELLVLVIFCDLSVANPPMWGWGGSSSSSAAKKSEPCIYGLESLERVNPTGSKTYQNPRIHVEHYDDATKFKYKLLGSHNELALENGGRNTNLLLLFEKKMKIQALDNNEILYTLDFEQASEANLVADYILSADSARYKKCTGSNAYKLEKLYKNATANTPASVEENLCVFKVRRCNATKFVIRRLAPREDQSRTLCVFRAADHDLKSLQDASKKFELRVYSRRQVMQPIYVLETSRPDKIQEFFDSK